MRETVFPGDSGIDIDGSPSYLVIEKSCVFPMASNFFGYIKKK